MNQEDEPTPLSLSSMMRKRGTKVLTVSASITKNQTTGSGVVVQTVRDSSGVLVSTQTLSLTDVEAQGLPLPVDALWR